MMRVLLGLAAAGMLMLQAACVTVPSGGEVRTDSDQSGAEKRARVRLELASAYFGRGQLPTALDEVKLALAAKPDLPDDFYDLYLVDPRFRVVAAVPAAYLGYRWWKHRSENGIRF